MKLLTKSSLFLIGASLTMISLASQQIETKNWQTFSNKSGSFSIKAPEGWSIADANDPAYKESVDKIKANNPKMANMFDSNTTNQFEIYLFDFGTASTKGVNNFNMKSMKDTGLTVKMYPDVAKEIFKQTSMTKTGYKVIDLPAGKTLSYWGSLKIAMGEGATLDVNSYGYMTIKGNIVYIYTLTTTAEADKVQKPIFDAMVRTVSIK